MKSYSLSLRSLYLSFFAVLLLLVACRQDNSPGIGYQQLTISDSITGTEIEVALWYPTDEPAKRERIEYLTANLAMDALPKGNRGLIVLSHGFAGSSLSHSDTAIHLAQNGFLVATPIHPDLMGVESDNPQLDPLVMRPRIISLLLDQILDNAEFKHTFDHQHIGIIGYSIGSYTALATLGGQPAITGLAEYCGSVPSDDLLCADWAEARFDVIADQLNFEPDTRIQAAVLLAPAYIPLFTQESLASVEQPIKIYQAEHDEELVEPYHTEQLRNILPQQPEHKLIADAGHFVFLSICPSRLKRNMPHLCVDPEGVDRKVVHDELNASILQFFASSFE